MTTVTTIDLHAFGPTYERLRPSLVRVAYLLTSDAQEASDIVQDAFEAAWPRWAEIDEPDAYLRRAVTNRAYNATRNRARRTDKVQRAGHDRKPDVPDHEYLGDLIAALPARQRAVVVLRFHLDLSYDEIAACLGLRAGSVGPTLHRALRALDPGAPTMTITDEQIRTALDGRIRAAGLDDPSGIPAPHEGDLRLIASRTGPARPRRAWVAAAAAIAVAGALAVGATRRGAPDRTTMTTPAAASTTELPAPSGQRPELPPPWPQLDVGPETKLEIGDPITTEEEFVTRLPDLDAQSQAEVERTGRVNVLDQLTGERLSVDVVGYDQQTRVVLAWYREHVGLTDSSDGSIAVTDMDPVMVFTDGSYRLIYRSDLDCTPLAADRPPPACALADLDERATAGG